MEKQEILSRVDHTLLKQNATWKDIKALCDTAIENRTASVCIPQFFVKKAKDYVDDKLKICTVIGFPNGNMTTVAKVFETKDCIRNGADEIDMVINISMLKDRQYYEVLSEIQHIKEACQDKVLKVIVETCLLTEDEKIRMCKIVTHSGAEYIKTSTGFSTAGATLDDIKLMKKHIGHGVKIKAAGGISSFEDAQNFIDAGADRLGTSRLCN